MMFCLLRDSGLPFGGDPRLLLRIALLKEVVMDLAGSEYIAH